MKIIVSSKALARALNRLGMIDFIETVGTEDGNDVEVKFFSNGSFAALYCVAREVKPHINQYARAWDWVYKVVNRIPDIPITMEITEQQVSITMNF